MRSNGASCSSNDHSSAISFIEILAEKKGQELADAVVLFEDVVLVVQVKAQCGNHEAKA